MGFEGAKDPVIEGASLFDSTKRYQRIQYSTSKIHRGHGGKVLAFSLCNAAFLCSMVIRASLFYCHPERWFWCGFERAKDPVIEGDSQV